MKFFGRIGFIFLSFFVFSCHNFLSEPENNSTTDSNLVKVSGSLTFEHGLESFFYKTQTDSRAVSKIDGKTITVLMQAERTVEASTETVSVGVNSTNYTYSVELPKDTWTFKIHMYFDEPSSITTDFNETDYSLSAEKTVNVGTDNTTNLSIPCTLRTGENQIVRFDLNISEETNITQYSILIDSSETASESPIVFSSGSYSTSLTNDLTTGLHSLIIYFKDTNNNLIYSIEEKLFIIYGINSLAFDNNNENFLDDNGNVKITSQVIQNRHANKIYFVDSSVTDDSTRTGTFFDPVASIQKAVNIIDSINDGTSEYEIRLNTDFKDESTSSYQSNMDNAYICLKGLKKSIKLKICSKDDTKKTIDVNRNSTYTGRIISAWSEDTTKTIDLTLENLILKGGCMNNGDGGALVISAGKLTVDNCEFIGNSSTNSGGAINIGNKHSTDSEIKNTKFDGNTCIGTTYTQFGNGGAIYTQKPLKISDCIFTDNGAKGIASNSGMGGAIYANSGSYSSIIDGCTFIHNYSIKSGGAIYLNNSKLKINDDFTNPTVFKFNYGNNANAIYLDGDPTNICITINSNVYFNNSANSKDADNATYLSKVGITTVNQTNHNNDIYVNKKNIKFNYVKTNDNLLPKTAPSTGSNLYYADEYTYVSLKSGDLEKDGSTVIFEEDSSDTNHLHKFIKTFGFTDFSYDAPYDGSSVSRIPVFNKDGAATFKPLASDLLQMPENLMIQINSRADLEQLLKLYSKVTASKNNIIVQTADIDCSTPASPAFSWTSCTFRDEYYGQGHKISGLTLSSDNSVGLFTTLSNAVIKQLQLDSPSISYTGDSNGIAGAGGFCNSMKNSKIINCSIVNGNIKSTTIAGGLVGNHGAANSISGVTNPQCLIINSYFEGTIERIENTITTYPYIGGICGMTNGSLYPFYILNSYFKGQIINPKPDDYSSGFIIGSANSNTVKIYNCFTHGFYSQGTGTKTYGIIGADTSPFNCYVDNKNFNDSEISKVPLKFSSSNSTENESYFSIIKDDYLKGDLVISGKNINTKIDIFKYSATENKFSKGNLNSVYTISGALNAFCNENNTSDFSSAFGELTPWTYDETNGIHFSSDGTPKAPVGIIFPAMVDDEPNPSTLSGKPIWIRCEEDFMALDGWNLGNTIELKTDFFMDKITGFVGSSIDNAVRLTLNGNNHTISYTLLNTYSGKNFAALFGYANFLNINNLTIKCKSFCLDSSATAASFLVARMKTGLINNCHIQIEEMNYNSSSSNKINCNFGCFVGEILDRFSGSDYLVETSEQLEILNCSVSGNMDFYEISNIQNFTYGGIVGNISTYSNVSYTNKITIEKCKNIINESEISTTNYNKIHLAGIAGLIEKDSLTSGDKPNVYIKTCLNRQSLAVNNASDTKPSYISGFANISDLDSTVIISNSVQNGTLTGLSPYSLVSGCVFIYEFFPSEGEPVPPCYVRLQNCAVISDTGYNQDNHYVVCGNSSLPSGKVTNVYHLTDMADTNHFINNPGTLDVSAYKMNKSGNDYYTVSGESVSGKISSSDVTWNSSLSDWTE